MSRIAALNDALRRDPLRGRWHVTPGVRALELTPGELYRAIRDHAGFTPENDPYGEHDFGSLELAGERLLWKIDYYDKVLEHHSPDPADEAVTARVLTVMLASEY